MQGATIPAQRRRGRPRGSLFQTDEERGSRRLRGSSSSANIGRVSGPWTSITGSRGTCRPARRGMPAPSPPVRGCPCNEELWTPRAPGAGAGPLPVACDGRNGDGAWPGAERRVPMPPEGGCQRPSSGKAGRAAGVAGACRAPPALPGVPADVEARGCPRASLREGGIIRPPRTVAAPGGKAGRGPSSGALPSAAGSPTAGAGTDSWGILPGGKNSGARRCPAVLPAGRIWAPGPKAGRLPPASAPGTAAVAPGGTAAAPGDAGTADAGAPVARSESRAAGAPARSVAADAGAGAEVSADGIQLS